ncbi:tail terminator protein [Shewanella phage S0112]|nr:tail terminator protein [Shewanella phage S0112]
MTTLNQARKAIYNRFIAAWGSTTEFVLYPEVYKGGDETADQEWVAVSTRHLPTPPATLGRKTTRRFTRSGIIFIQVFTPRNIGTSRIEELCEIAKEIFEGVRFDGVWTNQVTISEEDPDASAQKNLYYLVQCQFNYEEVK